MDTKNGIEEGLKVMGIEYLYVEEVQLQHIDIIASLHNQARIGHSLNQETVDSYSRSLISGDIFPPIMLLRQKNGKSIVLGGNHRIAACQKLLWDKWRYGAFLLVDISEAQKRMIIYKSNLTHGLPSAIEDRVEHALDLITTTGISQLEASMITKCTLGMIAGKIAYRAASERSERVGMVSVAKNMVPSNLARVNSIEDDDLFKKTLGYVQAKKLPIRDIDAVLRDLKQEKTVRAKIAHIEKLEADESKKKKATGGDNNKFDGIMRAISRAKSDTRKVIKEHSPLITDDVKVLIKNNLCDLRSVVEEAIRKY